MTSQLGNLGKDRSAHEAGLAVIPERRLTLLLTATVNPGETPFLVRTDPSARLQDYTWALRSWISASAVPRIVFCENSGHDLGTLKREAADWKGEVEFISFDGNASARVRGKGYSELKLIERAMAESRLIRCSDVVVKCTGRLALRNATAALRGIAEAEFDVMCSLKRHLSFADSRLFAATCGFLQDYLIPMAEVIDDFAGVYFEHALARATARALSNRLKWRPLPVFPRLAGVSGTSGLVMTDSPLKVAVKGIYHRAQNFVYQYEK